MIKQKNKVFAERLAAAMTIIGRDYVAITRRKYPKLSASLLRNVKNAGVEDWNVLAAFEDIARIIEKNFTPV